MEYWLINIESIKWIYLQKSQYHNKAVNLFINIYFFFFF